MVLLAVPVNEAGGDSCRIVKPARLADTGAGYGT